MCHGINIHLVDTLANSFIASLILKRISLQTVHFCWRSSHFVCITMHSPKCMAIRFRSLANLTTLPKNDVSLRWFNWIYILKSILYIWLFISCVHFKQICECTLSHFMQLVFGFRWNVQSIHSGSIDLEHDLYSHFGFSTWCGNRLFNYSWLTLWQHCWKNRMFYFLLL